MHDAFRVLHSIENTNGTNIYIGNVISQYNVHEVYLVRN